MNRWTLIIPQSRLPPSQICGPKVGRSGSYSACNTIYVTSRVIEIDYGMVETSWWGAGMLSFPRCTQPTIQSFPVVMWFLKKRVLEQLRRKPCDNWVGVWLDCGYTKTPSHSNTGLSLSVCLSHSMHLFSL